MGYLSDIHTLQLGQIKDQNYEMNLQSVLE